MYIKKLRVFNYKSYFDSGVMEFTPGINIIVGKNNAGKTSLLEVLTLDFENEPHRILDFEKYPDRSLRTLPNKISRIQEESRIEITLHLGKGEWRSFIQYMSPNIGIPIPSRTEEYIESLNRIDNKYREPYIGVGSNRDLIEKDKAKIHREFCIEQLIKLQSSLDDNNQETKISLYTNKQMDDMSLSKLVNFDTYEVVNSKKFLQVEYNTQDKEFHLSKGTEDENDNFQESIGYNIFDIFVSRIYRFKAERLNIGNCKFENNEKLKSDASNLAEVLFILQGKKPGTFSQFNEKVSSILDEIKYISVVMGDNSEVEIKVWITEELNRDDLSLPLSSCGSGVGQVLAIVYILVSSEEPRTLIIDEPQSFLHPGAAKKLIETIKQFPQHQYFISTHSPEIITTADPSKLIKLKYENCETTASVMEAKDINLQKAILDELGVRLSDVFGADSVLWVEGPTEEKCFPLIIEKFLATMPLKGMKILRVDSVSGLLDGKHTSLVARLHKQLTSEISLIPEKSIFIFDREGKKPENIKDLERIGFNFLKRPMYENYILHPEAISAIINEEREKTLADIGVENADFQWLKSPITSIQVQECFDKIQQEEKYLLQGIENDNWLFKVHGANVIHSVFQELCENQLHFNDNKPKYCRKITEWIIKNQPEFLYELAKELKECLNKELNILHKS